MACAPSAPGSGTRARGGRRSAGRGRSGLGTARRTHLSLDSTSHLRSELGSTRPTGRLWAPRACSARRSSGRVFDDQHRRLVAPHAASLDHARPPRGIVSRPATCRPRASSSAGALRAFCVHDLERVVSLEAKTPAQAGLSLVERTRIEPVTSGLQTQPIARPHLTPTDRSGMAEGIVRFVERRSTSFDRTSLAPRSHGRFLNGQHLRTPSPDLRLRSGSDGTRTRGLPP